MKRLAIIDISSFIFRAFYAIRVLNAPDGTPVNAVRGVWSMLSKLIEDYRPTHIFVAMDSKGDNFRNAIFPAYKANRSAPPPELIPQFALISELIDCMNLKKYSHQNYEADDVIGSACIQWRDHFDEIFIVTGDKDLMQFVGNNIFMLDTMKDVKYGRNEVFEKMGVWPEQIVDYLSIIGDASDNIPGMKGIGPKGASKLLEENKTLENCILNKDKFTGKKLVEAFEKHLDDALLSKKLIEIKTELDLGLRPDETKYNFHCNKKLKDYFEKLNFKSVLLKLAEMDQVENKEEEVIDGLSNPLISSESTRLLTEVDLKKIKEMFVSKIFDKKIFLCPFYDTSDQINIQITSVAFAFDSSEFFWFNSSSLQEKIEALTLLLQNKNEVVVIDSKVEISLCQQQNILYQCQFLDLTQIHYINNPSSNHEFKKIALQMLDVKLPEKGEMGDLQKDDSIIFLETMIRLEKVLSSDLAAYSLWPIYLNIDLPLVPILTKMENHGVCINIEYLKKLENEFQEELEKIESGVKAEIKNLNQQVEINIKSPKQVGHLLFDLLKYPVIKLTKTGFSTDSDVLEELDAKKIGPIPGLILKYREIDKLLSTYVKVLPALVHPVTKRVHTTFDQHTAATGRLASFNPNLQNIPIRTLNGKKIRKAFIAGPGKLLLSADYSLVELRILAHCSQDSTMLNAFKNDRDIHAETAAEILGIPQGELTDDQRSMAKAVNFGLMYGQSSFGLSQTLKISRAEAKNYIEKYFAKFNQVKSYLDSLKEFCETNGYSMTLHGRKRLLPDINSTNRTIKSSAERVAINGPIQGTAADIVKIAMIALDRDLTAKNLKSKLLLQIHDELVFEVPEKEVEEMTLLVKNRMETAASLSVPLKVNIGIGANWLDLR